MRPVTGAAGAVLVTSRDGSPQAWGPWCRLSRLGMLPVSEAAEVLADHAGRQAGLGGAEDARALAARLGCLPLALRIAGCYLAEAAGIPAAFADATTISSYAGYLDAIQEGGLARGFPQAGTAMTQDQARQVIGATWDVTLDRLDGQVAEARAVLRLLAAFADAPIPYHLLLDMALLAASPVVPGRAGPRAAPAHPRHQPPPRREPGPHTAPRPRRRAARARRYLPGGRAARGPGHAGRVAVADPARQRGLPGRGRGSSQPGLCAHRCGPSSSFHQPVPGQLGLPRRR